MGVRTWVGEAARGVPGPRWGAGVCLAGGEGREPPPAASGARSAAVCARVPSRRPDSPAAAPPAEPGPVSPRAAARPPPLQQLEPVSVPCRSPPPARAHGRRKLLKWSGKWPAGC